MVATKKTAILKIISSLGTSQKPWTELCEFVNRCQPDIANQICPAKIYKVSEKLWDHNPVVLFIRIVNNSAKKDVGAIWSCLNKLESGTLLTGKRPIPSIHWEQGIIYNNEEKPTSLQTPWKARLTTNQGKSLASELLYTKQQVVRQVEHATLGINHNKLTPLTFDQVWQDSLINKMN